MISADRLAEDRQTKPVSLALQGGGSHGAFAWGVLDRLLEDDGLSVEGIVGTSAGAMNAVVTASGLAKDGNDGARRALQRFWQTVAEQGSCSPLQPSWLDEMVSPGSMDYSPAWQMIDLLSRVWSPYQMNPSNYHPLRDILVEQVDFETLRKATRIKLFVCATNVLTNRLRVFSQEQITVEAVLASACLPSMFQAIEIDGEHYWDGGYMGNPPIFPLIYECASSDVILIMINPIVVSTVPKSAQAIIDRINTLSFNSSLMREMRAIAFVSGLVDKGFNDNGRLRKMFIHCIDAEEEMRRLGVSSKLNVKREFLEWLFNLGRRQGEAFLKAHYSDIGKRSSIDMEGRFL